MAELVSGVSGEKERRREKRPRRERKEAQLAHLREAEPEVLALKAADTLHNVQSILRDLRIHGERVWERFNAPREEQLWYYGSVAEIIAARLAGSELAGELMDEMEELRRAHAGSGRSGG